MSYQSQYTGTQIDEAVAQVETNKSAIETLNGDANTAGSVDKKIADALANSGNGNTTSSGVTAFNVTLEVYSDGEDFYTNAITSASELGAMVTSWLGCFNSDEYEEGAVSAQWFVHLVGGAGSVYMTYVPVAITKGSSDVTLQIFNMENGYPITYDITITTTGDVTVLSSATSGS